MSWFRSTKRINKVWNEIFFFGAGANDFFLIFYDDFVVGDFDDFGARNGELRVKKTFESWTLDDKLLDGKVVIGNCEVNDMSEFRAFFGFNLEVNEREFKVDNLADFDDIVFFDKFVGRINYGAEIRIFADAFRVKDILVATRSGSGNVKCDNFKIVRIDN